MLSTTLLETSFAVFIIRFTSGCCQARLRVALATLLLAASASQAQLQPVDFVDTRDGARPPTNCFVGVSSPWGLVNAAIFEEPMYTGNMRGVSTLNVQGTGCNFGALGHVIVGARTQSQVDSQANQSVPYVVTRSSAERLAVRYNNAVHEATATQRVAYHRIIPSAADGWISIDLGTGQVPARSVVLHAVDDTSFSATLEVGGFCGHDVYKAIHVFGVLKGASFSTMVADGQQRELGSRGGRSIVLNARLNSDTAYVQVGLSLVRPQNAMENWRVETVSNNFDSVCANVRNAWSHEFDRIVAFGGKHDDQRRFYTMFYRTLQHPNIASDVNGEFMRYNSDDVGMTTDYQRTVLHDIWGHFQTNVGYYGLFLPDMAENVMRTLADMTVEADITPQWDFLGRQMNIMYGDPFPLVVLDAVLNGTMTKHDLRKIYPILVRLTGKWSKVRHVQWMIDDYGFVPGRFPDGVRVMDNVTTHMEYSMSDEAIGILGETLGDSVVAASLRLRAKTIWNSFHQESGWFRPRLIGGSWSSEFMPDVFLEFEPHTTRLHPFKEGTGREFLFFPQHVRSELVQRLGGYSGFVNKLDPIFLNPARPYLVYNQMQMHLPWQYLYVPGAAHRTHVEVRNAIKTTYPVIDGSVRIHGNDDLGSTTAWYMLAAIGLYPTMGFEGTWLVASPAFDSVHCRIRSRDGGERLLRIVTTGSPDDTYVAGVSVDGRDVALTHIDDDVLRQASLVVIKRSSVPASQPTRWNRVVDSARFKSDSMEIFVSDPNRQTDLEVGFWSNQREILRRDTMFAQDRRLVVRVPVLESGRYRIRDLADPNGRNAWIDLQSPSETKIDNAEILILEVVPLPADHIVYVRLPWGRSLRRVVVHAISGEQLLDVEPQGSSFSVSGLPNGTYLARIELQDGQTVVKPIVIQR